MPKISVLPVPTITEGKDKVILNVLQFGRYIAKINYYNETKPLEDEHLLEIISEFSPHQMSKLEAGMRVQNDYMEVMANQESDGPDRPWNYQGD
tara:strand:+ start:488 stop:769 length:282 start_codon:yes stop_codon:yes gene_type:complete